MLVEKKILIYVKYRIMGIFNFLFSKSTDQIKDLVLEKSILLENSENYKNSNAVEVFVKELNRAFNGTARLISYDDFKDVFKAGSEYSGLQEDVESEEANYIKKIIISKFRYKNLLNTRWIDSILVDDDKPIPDMEKYLYQYLTTPRLYQLGLVENLSPDSDYPRWLTRHIGILNHFGGENSKTAIYDGPKNEDANNFLNKTLTKNNGYVFLQPNQYVDSEYSPEKSSQALKFYMLDCLIACYYPNVKNNFFIRLFTEKVYKPTDLLSIKGNIFYQACPFGYIFYNIKPEDKKLGPFDAIMKEYSD